MPDDKKKRGRGNPTPRKEGPIFDKRRDLPNDRAPYCNQLFKNPTVRDGTVEYLYCGKRGYHWKHGKGKRTRWK